MDNITIRRLKTQKNAYIGAAEMYMIMQGYKFHSDDDNKRFSLEHYASFLQGLPLPSGRWGNVIALALEFNNYTSAEYLIDNAERLGLVTKTVVSEFGGHNAWSLKDEYLYSLLTFEEEITPKEDLPVTEEEYQEYVAVELRNKEACERLKEKLEVNQEDMNVIKR